MKCNIYIFFFFFFFFFFGVKAGVKASEPPHTDMSSNVATVVIRAVLPEQRRRRTGLLPSGPKSSFQIKASFVFHLETRS